MSREDESAYVNVSEIPVVRRDSKPFNDHHRFANIFMLELKIVPYITHAGNMDIVLIM